MWSVQIFRNVRIYNLTAHHQIPKLHMLMCQSPKLRENLIVISQVVIATQKFPI